ncbi:MAG: hypothetical protein VB085_11855 [Peptococcaceae bacterium]|nr:hypothetical protein [Peptococcaceae bacterium]
MDETVRQMSIVQHDRRHFNNTLLPLLRQGEADKAADLIRQQSEALPQKPQSYCQNVSVNAAVSYYAELARQRGVRCELRLNIPEKLDIDELSLAMTVSNLMENAITAVSALPVKQRTLRFTAVALGENGFPISREEGRGKGTQSVAGFVKECEGELAYEISDGIFKVRLMV